MRLVVWIRDEAMQTFLNEKRRQYGTKSSYVRGLILRDMRGMSDVLEQSTIETTTKVVIAKRRPMIQVQDKNALLMLDELKKVLKARAEKYNEVSVV